MTFTLFDMTYRVARELGIVSEGVATSGSTTSIADTNARTESADFWNRGTAWILRDNGGSSAAPEREYSVVSDYASGTITLQETLTAAVAAGDRYAVAEPYVPLSILIQKVNQSLIDLGTIPYTDTTSLDIIADQTEYTLPGAANLDLRQVWLQTDNADTNDNRWTMLYNWRNHISDPGNADLLILPGQYTAGYALKLVYMSQHPSLYQRTDPLSEHVPPERVIYPAVLGCFEWLKQRHSSRKWDSDIASWMGRVNQVKTTHAIKAPRKPDKVLMTKPGTTYITPFDKVNLGG